MSSSFDVQVWGIERLASGSHRVRWAVSGRRFAETFRTKPLADGYRASLLKAARAGEPFDGDKGLPLSMAPKARRTWFEHAVAFAEMKWPVLAAKSRKSLAEALATATPALVKTTRGAPAPADLQRALYGWAFNPGNQGRERPPEIEAALAWIAGASVPRTALTDAELTRAALNACARRLDGKPAAATSMRRKRAVFHNALRYAVELDLLPANPLDKVQWKASEVAENVDRRVVANPAQVLAVLDALRDQGGAGEHLASFFACLYYAAMRPAEAIALHRDACLLPAEGWGRLNLIGSEPRAGAQWTDDGNARDARGLKHRGENAMRSVPIPPELVALLRDHIARYEIAPGGRMFRTARGEPIPDSTYTKVWRTARAAAFTPEQAASPLARRPYDLRHAAISLWLNSGVPATEVARRAGHGVAVMLKVYANCLDGDEPLMNDRITAALAAATHGKLPAAEA